MALQTIKSKNFERVTIRLDGNTMNMITERVRQQWQDLDRLLVQFLVSHSIRTEVMYSGSAGISNYAPIMLPELTRRELVNLVEYS